MTYAVARIDDPYRLQSQGHPLPVGTFVTARIDGTSLDDVIRVPRQALREPDQLIFVDDDSQLRIRTVRVIRSDAEFAYLGGGAAAGERIVITPMEAPVDGARVRTTDEADEDDATSLVSTEGVATE